MKIGTSVHELSTTLLISEQAPPCYNRTMTQEEAVKYWFESAKINASVANDNFKLGHYDWALFFWHLVLEKTLKGIIAKQGKTPPPIHNLAKLAQIAELALNAETRENLKTITAFNLEARYDDYKRSFYKKATPEYSQKWIAISKDIYKWLRRRKS